MLTPNHLEVLIHCHVSPSPHPRRFAPAVDQAIAHFLEHGMVRPDNHEKDVFHSTEKGKVWLQYLLDVPFPVETFKVPRATEGQSDD